MRINEKQIQAVLALSGPDRYRHFIKVVVDWEQAWGLHEDGWALAATEEGRRVFPLWPAKEYASLCAQREWSGYEPAAISLTDLIDELAPKLVKDGVRAGVFYTPSGEGVVQHVEALLHDLNEETKKYL